jgi:hypothetical protein
MDLDPSGDWLLFTIVKSQLPGARVYNLRSGKTCAVLPDSTAVKAERARFSPDGKRFCYIHTVANSETHRQETSLYIKDITLPATDPDATGIAVTAPAAFALTVNHPNPFNPSTTISFTLPASGAASLSVYNVAGQKIRELVNGPLGAGMHFVVWDGRDDSGKPVSSGVYLTRLTSGKHSATGRMLLAK